MSSHSQPTYARACFNFKHGTQGPTAILSMVLRIQAGDLSARVWRIVEVISIT